MAATTDRLDLIWHCRPITTRITLSVADKSPHHPTGAEGFLRVPTDTILGHTMVKTFYTPTTLPATIISPDAASTANGCSGYTSVSKRSSLDCCVILVDCRRRSQDISFPAQLVRTPYHSSHLHQLLIVWNVLRHQHYMSVPLSLFHLHLHMLMLNLHRRLPVIHVMDLVHVPMMTLWQMLHLKLLLTNLKPNSFTWPRLGYQSDINLQDLPDASIGVPSWSSTCATCQPVACDTPSPRTVADPADSTSYMIRHLTRDQLRILWHQRLGHLHSHHQVNDLHKYAIGVPNVPIASELDTCPVCIQAQLRHADRSKDSSCRAIKCNQGISIEDFGFIVQ
jgi:hypothetical protein